MKINNMFLKPTQAKALAEKVKATLLDKALKKETQGRKLAEKRKIGFKRSLLTRALQDSEFMHARIETTKAIALNIMNEYHIPKEQHASLLRKIELLVRTNHTADKVKQAKIEGEIKRDVELILNEEGSGRRFLLYLNWATESSWNHVAKHLKYD